MKKNLHASASTFMKEGKVPKRSAVDVIDAPAGFLCEWWSVFWDIFLARTNAKCSDAAAAYLKQLKEKDKQIQCDSLNLQMMHELRQQQTPDVCSSPFIVRLDPGIPEHISRQPAASARLYAELPRHGYAQQLDCSAYLDASQKLVTDHSRDVAQVSRRNLSMASGGLYPPPSRASSNIGDTNLTKNAKTGSLDPALCGVPANMQSRSKPLTDMSPGIKPLPLNGGPLMGSEHFQLNSAWVSPMQRPDRLQQSQLLMNLQQRQQLTDAPENCRSMFTANYSQPGKGSLIQLPSQLIGAVSENQAVDRPANCRKRKKSENLGTAKNAGMDDFTGASFTSALSAGHGKSAGNASGHSGMSRKNQPHVSVGMGGNTHPLEQLENLDNCHAATSLEDDVDSFLSHDYENAVDSSVGTLKRNFDPLNVDSLSEVACLRSSNSKVICCNFSSDGKLLASAGHDKKALLWNMDTLETKSLPEVHTLLITDVRFRPNSTYLATSSFDKTLRLWNAAESKPHRPDLPLPSSSLHDQCTVGVPE
ncbi:Transcriptional corepressor LEUNIG-like protein [Nymphaea thermarum]|nr:Transcriptional corepressor LEUNIG-like protein [Nymphaea thermarum]